MDRADGAAVLGSSMASSMASSTPASSESPPCSRCAATQRELAIRRSKQQQIYQESTRRAAECALLCSELSDVERQQRRSSPTRRGNSPPPETDDGSCTQGVAAAPRPPPPAAAAASSSGDSDDEAGAPTQGARAEPRRVHAPPPSHVRVAFTGIRAGALLERYRSLVVGLGGEVEQGDVMTAATTHCVVVPHASSEPMVTAKSVWAALTRKLLVPPAWLEECGRRGEFVEQGVGDASAYRGICNPLDGRRVLLTSAFRSQHAADATVGTLLTTQALLLRAASVVDEAASLGPRFSPSGSGQDLLGSESGVDAPPDFVFAADGEARPPGEGGVVYTWDAFVHGLPGHGRKRKRGGGGG